MKENNTKGLAMIICGMAVVSAIIDVYAVIKAMRTDTFDAAICLSVFMYAIVALFAIYYIVAGCRKNEAAGYFIWYLNGFGICQLLQLLNYEELNAICVLMSAIAFGVLCVLSVAKDLGRKKSFRLVGVLLVAMLIEMIDLAVVGGVSAVFFCGLSGLLMAGCTLMMVMAKYQDKAIRKRK